MPLDRPTVFGQLNDLLRSPESEARALADRLFAPHARWSAARPIEELNGVDAIWRGWFEPLRRALPHGRRRTSLFLAGSSITGSGEWLATMGHVVGAFAAPLFGVPPTDRLVLLRFGEFYRFENGRIAEVRALPDLVDLMRQAGLSPLPFDLGAEIAFPAPETGDGVRLEADADVGERSRALVEAMLSDLRAFDPRTFESANQTGAGGYWSEDMLWFGPGGIGSNHRYEGFEKDHRIPFLKAFPDRVGGDHFARFGDGPYVASGGWPSIRATHGGPYMGVPATGRAITMRVMDFWRCNESKIAENWVFIDMIDLFAQLGVDLFARAGLR